jgi:anthranilate phosphoribosyltransferase
MNITDIYFSQDNPLVQGIKIIGIGKHGSKTLPMPLLEEISGYIQTKEILSIQKGAFFGALMAKGPTAEEKRLLIDLCGADDNVEALYDHLCGNSPAHMKVIGIKLLSRDTLSVNEAQQLGNYLFSDEPGEAFRGMAVSMLRIRYETEEEYEGLYKAVVAVFAPGFQKTHPDSEAFIQLAEPFDGVEHSYMITPLLAQAFQKKEYRVIVTTGRSSGPKLALNPLDIYQAIGGETFIQNIQSLPEVPPPCGWVLDQAALSPALDQWVDRRRLIFKRPFLATLEKVLNPCSAKILITSVFHITYMEKMITLAAMAGFVGVIVLKRGLEGTLAPSIAKASGILCAVIQADGSLITQTFDATHDNFTPFRAEADEVVEDLTVEENIRLIRSFQEKGFTGNEDFDKRVNLAIALYSTGLDWIAQHLS